MQIKYGACAKHPNESMIDCPLCEMGNSRIKNPINEISAESIVEGISDILYFNKISIEERNQKAIVFMEKVIADIKRNNKKQKYVFNSR